MRPLVRRRWMAVVLLLWACSSSTEYTEPDPADGPPRASSTGGELIVLSPVVETPQLRIGPPASPTQPMSDHPALRFDLSTVPAGAAIHRAILRLRRAEVSWTGTGELPPVVAIEVIDVNHGLRIADAYEGPPGDTTRIDTAARTDDEDALWREVSVQGGSRRRGIELASALYAGVPYIGLLADWNPVVRRGLVPRGPWDEVDVTELVEAEVTGDGSLTVVLYYRDDEVTLTWFGTGVGGERAAQVAPHLVIEYARGGAPRVAASSEDSEDPGVFGGEELVAAPGQILVTSDPWGARVYIDGELVGTTSSDEPLVLPLPVGSVALRLVHRDYQPWEERLRVLPGARQTLHAVLEPNEGQGEGDQVEGAPSESASQPGEGEGSGVSVER